MRKAKKEKRTMGILAGSGNDSDGPGGEDPSSIQINEDYARRDEAPPPQRLEECREEGLQQLPASEESSDVVEDDEESSEEDDAIIASRRVDRRVFEAIRRIRSGEDVVDVYSSEDDAEEEDLKQEKRKVNKEKPVYLKDVNARHLLDEGPEATAQARRSSKYDRIAYDGQGQQKKGLQAFLEAQKDVLGDGDDDDLFQVKPKVGAGADHQEEEEEEEKQATELAGEVFGNDEELDENEKLTRHKKLSKDLILGCKKKEGEKKDKSGKQSRTREGPSSSEPNKRKSTRSRRRKRRDGDLKMSTKRQVAYGIIKPKRPKNH